ncbi:MAG: phage holin family protein [Planctomycetales bacterium]|nr:phage holin family protein [Planctomycetales bacterium]
MVRQTSLNGRYEADRGSTEPVDSDVDRRQPSAGVRSSTARLLSGLSDLFEVQLTLLRQDARAAVRRSVAPVVLAVCAIVVLLSAMPVALLGLSTLLADSSNLSTAGARLVVAGGATTLACGLGFVAINRFRKIPEPMIESLEELAKSARQLRDTVARSDG